MEQRDLIRYINGDNTHADEVLAWAKEDPAREKMLEQLAMAAYAQRFKTKERTFQPKKAWCKVRGRLLWRKLKPAWLSLIFIVLFAVCFLLLPPQAGDEWVTLSPGKNSKVQIALPDGTLACLNAHSSISFPAYFQRAGERRIRLAGEAYFVAKHDSRPLIVETDGGVVVTDLGTRFNVQAYPGDSVVLVALLEGAVKAEVNRDGATISSTILRPGESFFYNNNSGDISVTDYGLDSVPWMDNRLIFEDTPLAEVARQLTHSQNVVVKVDDPGVGRIRFSGTFDNRDIDTILSYIEQSCGVLPVRKEGEIVLSKHNNL